jgi:hypothetical protein
MLPYVNTLYCLVLNIGSITRILGEMGAAFDKKWTEQK